MFSRGPSSPHITGLAPSGHGEHHCLRHLSAGGVHTVRPGHSGLGDTCGSHTHSSRGRQPEQGPALSPQTWDAGDGHRQEMAARTRAPPSGRAQYPRAPVAISWPSGNLARWPVSTVPQCLPWADSVHGWLFLDGRERKHRKTRGSYLHNGFIHSLA